MLGFFAECAAKKWPLPGQQKSGVEEDRSQLHPERWLLYFLSMADDLSERYQDLLTGSYDCVDRMVLNGYFRPGHSAGGFRIWWHNLTGTVETLDNTHRMRLAGRFSRRIRAGPRQRGSRDRLSSGPKEA